MDEQQQKIVVKPDWDGNKTVYMAYDYNYYGCMAQGHTPEEARANLDDARRDYVATMAERKENGG